MKKRVRAPYIAARLVNGRPLDEPFTEFAKRAGIPNTWTVKNLCNMEDLKCGMLYKICKAFGYQVMIYNPTPPEGLESIYVLGTDKCPISPRENKGYFGLRRDAYTGTIYRVPKKYKRKKKVNIKTFKEVKHNGKEG